MAHKITFAGADPELLEKTILKVNGEPMPMIDPIVPDTFMETLGVTRDIAFVLFKGVLDYKLSEQETTLFSQWTTEQVKHIVRHIFQYPYIVLYTSKSTLFMVGIHRLGRRVLLDARQTFLYKWIHNEYSTMLKFKEKRDIEIRATSLMRKYGYVSSNSLKCIGLNSDGLMSPEIELRFRYGPYENAMSTLYTKHLIDEGLFGELFQKQYDQVAYTQVFVLLKLCMNRKCVPIEVSANMCKYLQYPIWIPMKR